MSADDRLTRAERSDLQKVARMRARVARNGIDALKAQRLMQFEQELAARYDFDDSAWSELTTEAERMVREADAEIARRCEQLGIPKDFRPGLSIGWYSAGKNADEKVRAELRRLAKVELDAAGKSAKQEIDRAELEVVTEIIAVDMRPAAAELLANMPSVEQLIPTLDLDALEAQKKPPRLRALGWDAG